MQRISSMGKIVSAHSLQIFVPGAITLSQKIQRGGNKSSKKTEEIF
jgi:hypothetical protein